MPLPSPAGLVLLLAAAAAPVHAAPDGQAGGTAASAVAKADALANLARFVAWPPSALPADGGPFRLCVVGSDPFADVLGAIDGWLVQGRPLAVRPTATDAGTAGCHIAYLASSERRWRDAVIAALAGRPVLTVSADPGFAEAGGMVMLDDSGERVRLRINPQAATRSGLHISAQLLMLADIVSTAPAAVRP